jgi:hypothetical protein
VITVLCLYLGAILSVVILVLEYFFQGMTYQTLALVVVGVVWVLGQIRWTWIGSLGMVFVTIAALAGVFLGLPVLPMISAIMFAFIAWDLSDFNGRLKLAAKQDDVRNLERNHLLRLGLVLGAGWGVVLLTRIIRVRFTFEIAALLALLGVWGISQLVGKLRRNE